MNQNACFNVTVEGFEEDYRIYKLLIKEVIKITIEKYINKIVEDTGLTRKEIQYLIEEKKNELKNLNTDNDILFIIANELSVNLNENLPIPIEIYINKMVENTGLTRKEIQILVKEKKNGLKNLTSDKDALAILANELGVHLYKDLPIPTETYFNKIVEATGLPSEEIQRLVKEKKEELNNLISDEEIVIIIARELGIDMLDINQDILEGIFNQIVKSLILKKDGTYIFKNQNYRFAKISYFGKESFLPSDNEISQIFERKIVPLIPYAVIYIGHDLLGYFQKKIVRLHIEIDINPKNKNFHDINYIHKELDFFESIRTLFFPTTKEVKIKIGKSILQPQYISDEVIKDFIVKGKFLTYVKKGIKTSKEFKGLSASLLDELIENYVENKKFRNPIPIEKDTFPIEEMDYSKELHYMKGFFIDFLQYYKKIVEDNFYLVRNFFYLYSNLPVIIEIYGEKARDFSISETVKIKCVFKKLPKNFENKVIVSEVPESASRYKDFLFKIETYASYLIYEDNNTLNFTYDYLEGELKDILGKIKDKTFFNNFQPIQVELISHLEEKLSEAKAHFLEIHARKALEKEYGYNIIENENNLFCNRIQIDLLFNEECIQDKKSKSIEIDIFGNKKNHDRMNYIFGECKSGSKGISTEELKCFIIKANIFGNLYLKFHETKGHKKPIFHLVIVSLNGFPQNIRINDFLKEFWKLPKKRILNEKIELINLQEFIRLLKKHNITTKFY